MRQEVLQHIEEIALDKKMHVIRWTGIVALKVAFKMNIGIYVNEPAVLKVSIFNKTHFFIFIPIKNNRGTPKK